MPKKKATPLSDNRQMRPALSPEARDSQMISLAYDLVEQRILDGTATSQETVHFLRLGSQKARQELEMMELEKEKLKAQISQIKSSEVTEKLYAEAIRAFGIYSGQDHGENQNLQ